MNLILILGRLLLVVGVGMLIAKYAFGVSSIEGWSLYPLIFGVLLSSISASKKRNLEDG